MKNPWIIPAATLAVGAIGGFISGKGASSSDTAAASFESAQRERAGSRSASGADEESKRASSRVKSVADAVNTPGHSARVKALIDYYATLTPEQLAEESKKLENLPMSERIMASILLFGRWAEVDPMSAMANSNTMGMAGMFVKPTILQSWASVDPENAAKYYSENPREFAMMGGMGRGPGGQNGASMIAGEWAKQDPQGALAWAASLSGADKNDGMASVIREVATTDPKKASELVGSMDPDERGQAYASIAQSWGASNFSEGLAWVQTLPESERSAAQASLINGLSQTDPKAASLQIASMAEGDDRNRAVQNVVENWSKTDPKAAIAFLMTEEDADTQARGIGDAISNWVGQDTQAAHAYVETLESGDVRDEAVSRLVGADTKSEPSVLMEMAETIDDERERGQTMGLAAMKWMREDETAAKAYIQNSTAINDGMKQRLLNNNRGGFRGGPGRGR